jgi:hypothetical protein
MIAPTEVRTGLGRGWPVMTWRSCSLLQPDSSITVATRP